MTGVLQCLICKKSFTSLRGVKKHMDTHRREDGRLEIPLTRIRIFTSDHEKLRALAESPLEPTRYVVNKILKGLKV